MMSITHPLPHSHAHGHARTEARTHSLSLRSIGYRLTHTLTHTHTRTLSAGASWVIDSHGAWVWWWWPQRLWFKTNLKLAKLWLDREEYGRLARILRLLHQACRTETGEDDTKKGTQLLEVYALEIQMHTATRNNKQLKARLCAPRRCPRTPHGQRHSHVVLRTCRRLSVWCVRSDR
jgi:hypothetical protein